MRTTRFGAPRFSRRQGLEIREIGGARLTPPGPIQTDCLYVRLRLQSLQKAIATPSVLPSRSLAFKLWRVGAARSSLKLLGLKWWGLKFRRGNEALMLTPPPLRTNSARRGWGERMNWNGPVEEGGGAFWLRINAVRARLKCLCRAYMTTSLGKSARGTRELAGWSCFCSPRFARRPLLVCSPGLPSATVR